MLRNAHRTFLACQILDAPLWAMYTLLVFFLKKDLGGTQQQITFLTSLKPTVAFLSFYWTSLALRRQTGLKSCLITATLLGALPALLLPLLNNNWLIIAAFGLYFMADRAVIPAWMEILKLSLPEEKHRRIASYSSFIMFFSSSIVPVFFGRLMDANVDMWRYLYPLLAALSLARVILQLRIIVPAGADRETSNRSVKDMLIQPFTESWKLLRRRKDFAWYQSIFFFGGAGIMIMQPTIPAFLVDTLHFSYTEMAIAIATCKGMGFVVTTKLWRRWLGNANIYAFSGWVAVLAGFFAITLMGASFSVAFVYLAYFLYGVMQGGSQLSWLMSGPVFAKDEDSTLYSGVNILAVGIRGSVAPSIGTLVGAWFGSYLSLLVGSITCVAGGLLGFAGKRKFAEEDSAAGDIA